MSTSTSTSSKTPPLPSRIKLANPATRTYTGKHPSGQQRSVGSGTKTRPPPPPSPTFNSNTGGGGGGVGGAGSTSNGVMSNANTGPGTRVSGRRTVHKPGEFANLVKGKGRGSSVDDKGKGTGAEEEGESIVVRGAPAKVGLRLAGKKPLLAVTVWRGGAQLSWEREAETEGTQLTLSTRCV